VYDHRKHPGVRLRGSRKREAALARVESDAPDLLLTDLKLPNMSGVDLLKQTKQLLPHTEVAIMTGHGSIESAVDAMKLGAYDYIEKPFRVEKMRFAVAAHGGKVRLVTENEFLRERVTTEENLDGIIGSSANIQDVLRHDFPAQGHTDASAHFRRERHGKGAGGSCNPLPGAMAKTPFIAVDCGSLVPTLMESELFGTRKARLPEQQKSKAGFFKRRMAGPSFWMRSENCLRNAGKITSRLAGKRGPARRQQ